VNDLDFRTPAPRPAPEAVRARIAERLAQETRRRPRLPLLVAAAVALLLVGATLFGVGQLRSRPPEPAAPGPLGSLDVGPLAPQVARADLDLCRTGLEDEGGRTSSWTLRSGRIQRVGPAGTPVRVVLASGPAGTLRCVDGEVSDSTTETLPTVPDGVDAATATAVVIEARPSPRCGSQPTQDGEAVLLQVGPTVRSARVRWMMDGQPGAWAGSAAEGGLVNLPVTVPSDAAAAASLDLELQALDAGGAGVPILLAGGSRTGDDPLVTPLPTCADQAGTAERPADADRGLQECRRLTAAAGMGSREDVAVLDGLAVFADPTRFAMVIGNRNLQVLCSLYPARGVKVISSGSTPDATRPYFFQLEGRGGDPVRLWTGGQLEPGVVGITYTFPDGQRTEALVEDGFWTVAYASAQPFLPDGRPMGQLPPVEVDLRLDDGGTRHLTIPFTSDSACDAVLPTPDC
jgi:hypothetical protein